MRWILLTLICLLSFPLQAKNYLAFLGGSGDPAGDTTIFDSTIAPLGAFSSSASYEAQVAFDGGRTQTVAKLTASFPDSDVKNFESQNFEALVGRYEEGLRNGTITSADQLLLMIDSHGAARGGRDTITHHISAGSAEAKDLNNLAGSTTVSLDRLQALANLAREKGVRLGIVDMSCHSGASLPLANTHTCVISASGPDSFAYGGEDKWIFVNRFISTMGKGKSLEDVFLTARASSANTDLGFPMISTPEGISIQDEIYPILKKYLNYSQAESDKLRKEIIDSVINGSCEQEDAELQRINELASQLEAVNRGLDLQPLRDALRNYQDYRKRIQTQLRMNGVGILKENRRICYRPGVCENVQVSSLIGMKPDDMIAFNQRQIAGERNPREVRHYQEMVTYYRDVKEKQSEVLRLYPGIRGYATLVQNYPDIASRTEALARQVAFESRKLYQSLYQKSEAPNACRSFIL